MSHSPLGHQGSSASLIDAGFQAQHELQPIQTQSRDVAEEPAPKDEKGIRPTEPPSSKSHAGLFATFVHTLSLPPPSTTKPYMNIISVFSKTIFQTEGIVAATLTPPTTTNSINDLALAFPMVSCPSTTPSRESLSKFRVLGKFSLPTASLAFLKVAASCSLQFFSFPFDTDSMEQDLGH
ncbi:hypothetical protein AK812_SmicGene4184 [Symbiodinium microadriaticum]|uniref:Uncharacterized protein n=1 Tax=Symbiodinium microadriaticum TaxID=2951 RepID=A0A1Q9EX59_SYMMI|nr:hypothetical protein AK812_SmicGene4184 [Symbiodinium microadriaticum]